MKPQEIDRALFIYEKDTKIKVLNLNQALENHNKMIADGYKHVATVDPVMYIEYSYNDIENLRR